MKEKSNETEVVNNTKFNEGLEYILKKYADAWRKLARASVMKDAKGPKESNKY